MITKPPSVGPGALPKEPTDALPGSEEKICIMIERAARREQLFHPLDGPAAKLRPDGRSWPVEAPPSGGNLCSLPEFEILRFEEEELDDLEEASDAPVEEAGK